MDQIRQTAKQLPTLHYTPTKGYFARLQPSIMTGMIREAIDIDLWKGSGIAIKLRWNFAVWCHMVAPEWCIVKYRKTVIKDAARWTMHAGGENAQFEKIKEKWRDSLKEQLNLMESGFWATQSASEAIFDILNDPGVTEKASAAQKEKMALCMIYALWKERDEDIDYDPNIRIVDFARYIENGHADEYGSFSPWFAVYWILITSDFRVIDIHDETLKTRVATLMGDLQKHAIKYFSRGKRERENAYLLKQLKSDLPHDPSEYEKVADHDPDLLNLVYNIHGVEYWGVCLDRSHLVNSTVNSVLSKAIQAAKKDMEKIAKEKLGEDMTSNPQAYAKRRLEEAGRVLIRTGVSQISESLQDELYKLFSPAHMAEGAAPLALSILIRSEMLKLSTEYSPAQFRFMMPQIINSISPLLLASAVRITQSAFKALQQVQARTAAKSQVENV